MPPLARQAAEEAALLRRADGGPAQMGGAAQRGKPPGAVHAGGARGLCYAAPGILAASPRNSRL
jgi:hypothetical protein